MFSRFSNDEYALLAEAARAAGLTLTGYVAEAALAAARGVHAPSTLPLREALVELMAARTQVRKFGTNVNQAVRELNSLGQAPEWLPQAVRLTSQAVSRLEAAAGVVADASRAERRRPQPRRGAQAPPDSQSGAQEREAS
nr:DUF1778 domain-containing protein [Vallicoccus soli]